MKLLKYITVLALASVSVGLYAQSTPPKEDTPREHRGPEQRRGPQERPRLEFLASKLNLTEDQRTAVDQILKEEVAALREARQNGTNFREAARAIHEATKKKIRALLTPEQQEIFDKLDLSGTPRPGSRPAPKQPEKIDISAIPVSPS